MSGSASRRARALVLVALLVALHAAGPAAGARVVDAHSTLRLDGVLIPVKFSAGLTGTSTFGANRTYAQTTVPTSGTLVSSTSLLSIDGGSESHTTYIRFVSVTGLPKIVEARVSLATTDQVLIRNGEILQTSGLGVTLVTGTSLLAGGDLQISKGQNAAMTLEVVSTSTAGVEIVETWVLKLSG